MYLNLWHKITNQTKVFLNVFHRNELNFKCIKGSQKVRTVQCKNCPNVIPFLEEFLANNIYSLIKYDKTSHNLQ